MRLFLFHKCNQCDYDSPLAGNLTTHNMICVMVIVLRVPKNVINEGAAQLCFGEGEKFCSHKCNQCEYDSFLAGNLNNQIILHRRRSLISCLYYAGGGLPMLLLGRE